MLSRRTVFAGVVIILIWCCFAHDKLSNDENDGTRPLTMRFSIDEEDHVVANDSVPIILYWYDTVYPHRDTVTKQCKYGKCKVSKNRAMIEDHDTRMILFYGSSFMANDLPLPRKKTHLWALFHEESPKNNWLFSHEDGMRVFNYTATFRRESDYPLATQNIVKVEKFLKPKHFVTTAEKNRLQKEKGFAPAVYVQRARSPSDRDTYIKELMKHLKIDSYGPSLNNKKMPEEYDGFIKLHNDGFYQFLAQYKFNLAFENSICQDYMTEKLFRPLSIGSVPIYRGSPLAKEFMPSDTAMVLVDDFNSPKELADFINFLDTNDDEYNKYLKHVNEGLTNDKLKEHMSKRYWHIEHQYEEVNAGHLMFANYECFLCDKIYERSMQTKKHLKEPSLFEMPEPSIANRNHLGCPKPKQSLSDAKPIFTNYDEGDVEGKALIEMLLAKETDSSKFRSKYLNVQTDKYA